MLSLNDYAFSNIKELDAKTIYHVISDGSFKIDSESEKTKNIIQHQWMKDRSGYASTYGEILFQVIHKLLYKTTIRMIHESEGPYASSFHKNIVVEAK